MNKYVTKTGQNIFDVALELYGSIEGVFDLLVSNDSISFDTQFQKGIELSYHESFIINQDIAKWFKKNEMVIKNGFYNASDVTIRDTILNLIERCNADVERAYRAGRINARQYSHTQDDSTSSKWAKPYVLADEWASTEEAMEYAIRISKTTDILTSVFPDDTPSRLYMLSKFYHYGLILIPQTEDENEYFYEVTAEPKLVAYQSGKYSEIKMQVKAGHFVVIDWGDGTAPELFHYSNATLTVSHGYIDSNVHKIVVYGNPHFINLDLSRLNGVYYPLDIIPTENIFVSPYKHLSELNKLFIKKRKQ